MIAVETLGWVLFVALCLASGAMLWVGALEVFGFVEFAPCPRCGWIWVTGPPQPQRCPYCRVPAWAAGLGSLAHHVPSAGHVFSHRHSGTFSSRSHPRT